MSCGALLFSGAVYVGAAAPGSSIKCRGCGLGQYYGQEVGLLVGMAWVRTLKCASSKVVSSDNVPQSGLLDDMLGQRPRMWCSVRGLCAVGLSSVSCG